MDNGLDFSRAPLTPFAHQREDTAALVQQPWLFITSEMRTGKTKIVCDGAQFLYEAGIISRVMVVCPEPVVDEWFDEETGQIKRHAWAGVPIMVSRYHSKLSQWTQHYTPGAHTPLRWVVTNFEFLRNNSRVSYLKPLIGKRTLIVIDEASFIKNWKVKQTKSVVELRKLCGRVVLLNGTPISQTPLDLFSQGNLLHPSILDCRFITHFKARYAKMEKVRGAGGKVLTDPRGNDIERISGWVNLEDLQRRFAPYVIRRLQKDCLDLPPKLDPVTLTATLTSATWKTYKAMRDELVIWFADNSTASAAQASIKVMRLSQITSGFVGGVEARPEVFDEFKHGDHGDEPPDALWDTDDETPPTALGVREVGREKLDVFLWFLKTHLEKNPTLHLVVWCRFRAELDRLLLEVQQTFPDMIVGAIRGGQTGKKRKERLDALRLLKPQTSPQDKAVLVGGIYGTGSYGLDFTAANVSVNCSFDYSLGRFLQSKDRVYDPGQVSPVAYFDIIATGPDGQRTIDHAILGARLKNETTANWTTAAWVTALKRE